MSSGNDYFYSRLPVNEIPLKELLLEEHLFYRIPPDWFVVVTDIRHSTDILKQGKHEIVNLVATGSIVAVLNIAYRARLSIPYFFGGDGATFIVPPTLLPTIIQALKEHHEQSKKNFQLDIRVGFVEVKEIYNQREELNIGKLRTSRLFIIPIVLGNGLTLAEKIVKSPSYSIPETEQVTARLDLQGMQCRWDLVKPPLQNNEVVSLIVIAMPGVRQQAVFKKVIDFLDEIYGEASIRQPITASRLKLKASIARIGIEMKARLGKLNVFYGIRAWLAAVLGLVFFKTNYGKKYLDRLIEMSDTLVMDGRINTVITGTIVQREKLQNALDQLESSGELMYGLSTSSESVMSCYVRNLNDRHVHFVDGAGGGYTRAAIVLKKKMETTSNSANENQIQFK